MTEQDTYTWWLEPRDPMVVRDGAQVPALVPRHPFWLPPPSTVAGLVRSRFVAHAARVEGTTAQALLDIEIRGPWLFEGIEEGTDCKKERPDAKKENPGPDGRKRQRFWLPVPADVRVAGVDETSGNIELARAELIKPTASEGVYWPQGQDQDFLFHLRDRQENGTKTRPPGFPYWPFDAVMEWSLGGDPHTALRPNEKLPDRDNVPIEREYRIHVSLDDATLTAEPEALFSSGGLRFRNGFGLALEVTDHRPNVPHHHPDLEHLVVLGAESRTTRLCVKKGECFPPFKKTADSPYQDYGERYRQRIAAIETAGHDLGLRLQLLTPGCFEGWQPDWPPELLEGDARLRAVCLDRYMTVSGWNLQTGGPRAVRRLVPPGSIYVLGSYTAERLLELCEAWWGRSLCTGKGDPTQHLAAPANDGYGLVLPSPCALPK